LGTEGHAEQFSAKSAGSRKIIHIDMDAFYASVEQRDNPELRGKPVAVGGSRERGVVAAASYEARQFGVHSAMPSVTAKRKCPDLIFVKPRFDAYKAISLQIREIFAEYTPMCFPPRNSAAKTRRRVQVMVFSPALTPLLVVSRRKASHAAPLT